MRSTVLESLEDFKEYEESWEVLRKGCKAPIFASYDLVHLWLDNFKAEVKPYIVLIEDGEELIGAAPMCTGHTRVMGLPVNSIAMVGELSPLFFYNSHGVFAKEDDPEAIVEMVKSVKRARWNKLFMPCMETNGSTEKFLEGIFHVCGGRPLTSTTYVSHYYVYPLEGNINANIGKATRGSIQKARNKLEKEGRMEFRKVGSVEDAERAMDLYLSQHEERWQNKNTIMLSQSNRRMLMELAKLVIRTGIGEICELLIDGEVAGQALNVFDGDVTCGIRLGMSNKFRDFSPGLLLITLIMEDSRKRGLKVFDPGAGNDSYKLRITNNHRSLGSALAYRGTLGVVSRVRSIPAIKVLENRLMSQDQTERLENNN
jgi:hypothetical protein